jgi:cytochrome P450
LHLCLGAHLTRVEVEAGLARVLARRSSFSLDVPVQNVRWLARPGMRGPVALPLRIAGARRQPHAA